MNETMKASIENEFNYQMKTYDERLNTTIYFYAILFDLALVKALEGNVTALRCAGTFQKKRMNCSRKWNRNKEPRALGPGFFRTTPFREDT